ncbi:hypothetical protein RSOLAG1IB_07775 [Rhizoctonia solani AG-1 IB]|uniref:Integral membrane protein n=1 Tax=Thanatephorus cucumeris (strain AG1-IB / isolate 7/3/14) TaxID=1108050 RepID=A0A0B7FHF3_THACB|nr:hypothetical protein RSOLAG1IB_07775 [Rhizoctonia solani AG-1 IB]
MGAASFGLTSGQLVLLAILQGITQGALFPLLISFLASKRTNHRWFKIYVIFTNVLSLSHTIIRVVEAFSSLEPTPRLLPFELSSIFVTCSTAAFTQAFFIYRCWRIFNRRTIFIVPFLIALLTALVSGALIGLFSAGAIPHTWHMIEIALATWAFSAFTLDFCMTLITIVYLYRLRANHNEHDSVFLTVWHVIWGSAMLPLCLMALVILDVYILPQSVLPSPLAAAMTEKFLLLSLMITLMGQGYVRRQLDQPRRSLSSNPIASQCVTGFVSEPVFASGSGAYELQTRSILGTTRSGYGSDTTGRDPDLEDPDKRYLSVAKPQIPEPGQPIQLHLS